MKNSVVLWSLLVLLPLTATAHAGQVIFRETETGIYVELTDESENMPDEQVSRKTRVTEAQAAAQPSSSSREEGAAASPPAAVKAAEQGTDRKNGLSKRKEDRRKARGLQKSLQGAQGTPEEE